MVWISVAIGMLSVAAGARFWWRRHQRRAQARAGPIDDAAVRQIIEEGRLRASEEDAPLDMRAAAEAEEEFWDEWWDEPEEYGP